MVLECLYSHSHSKVGLSRTRRTYSHNYGVSCNSVNIFFLPEGLCLDHLARGSDAYSAVGKLYRFLYGVFLHHGENISHTLFIYGFTLVSHGSQCFNSSLGSVYVILAAAYAYIVSSAQYGYIILPLQYIYVFIEFSEQCNDAVH